MKKTSDIQEAGNEGESDFASWASKMGWHCTPTSKGNDFGTDFYCQIRGAKCGARTWEMPPDVLGVSVKSTQQGSDTVSINKDDADHLLKAKYH